MTKAEQNAAVLSDLLAGKITRDKALLKLAQINRTRVRGRRAKTWPHMKVSHKRNISKVQLALYPKRAQSKFFEKMDFYRKEEEK